MPAAITTSSTRTSPSSVITRTPPDIGASWRTRVRQLAPISGGVRVITDDGEVLVDEVVIAAGIWSPPLVKPFGVKPLLAAERGYHLMLRDPQISLRRPVGAGDDKFIITPLAGGIRLAGTAE